MRLERALRLLEESQEASVRTPSMVREDNSQRSATPVPHVTIGWESMTRLTRKPWIRLQLEW